MKLIQQGLHRMVAHVAGEIDIEHIAPRAVLERTRVDFGHVDAVVRDGVQHGDERTGRIGNVERDLDAVILRLTGQRFADGDKSVFRCAACR